MNGTSPDASHARGGKLAGMALIVLATFAAYFPVFCAGFVWNDADYVTKPALRSWTGLWRIWFHVGATEQYYPILHSAFWFEHRLWGDAPLGYHLFNVALHATSAVLLLILLRKLAIPGAWLASIVFALHPVCVESVAWIAEQKNTLSTAFYLLAAIACLRFFEKRSSGRYALASLLFVLAVLSKTVTATLPAALLVVAWWRTGRLSWRRDVSPLLPWLVFGAAAGLASGWVERSIGGAHGPAFAMSGIDRLLLAGRVVWFYAAKLLWPANLVFNYPRWKITDASIGAHGYLIALVIAFAGLAALCRRSRAPLASGLLFAGTLFPTLGFFNVYGFIYSYVADHWQYLASMGMIAPLCAGITVSMRGLPLGVRRSAAAVFLTSLAVLTWNQAGMYHDLATFYRTTIARNPDAWMAHNNLALLLQKEGRGDEAIKHFEAALRANNDVAEVHNDFGISLAEAGRLEDAARQYRAALDLKPNYFEAWNNLGVLLNRTQHLPEAMRAFDEALRLRPDYAPAHYNRGVALLSSGQPEKAAADLKQALGGGQHAGEAHLYLGEALAGLKRDQEATSEYAEAARLLRPDNGPSWLDLGNALMRQGQLPAAAAAFSTAAKAEPENADAAFALGNALAAQGQYAAAVIAYRHALVSAPESANIHNNLGNALFLSGDMAAAVSEFREALRDRPGDPNIRESLDRAVQAAKSQAASR
jgi:tetratricopeptide (TPR) repeat protein